MLGNQQSHASTAARAGGETLINTHNYAEVNWFGEERRGEDGSGRRNGVCEAALSARSRSMTSNVQTHFSSPSLTPSLG